MNVDLAVRPGRRLRRLPSGYRPAATATLVLKSGLLVGTLLAGLALAALLTLYGSLRHGRGLTEALDRVAWLTTVITWVGLITAVAWVAWLRRVYRNLRPLGARDQRLGPGWAVGAWFVPGANLVIPKLLTDDIWRSSVLHAPHPIGTTWKDTPVPRWLDLWWAAVATTALLWVGGALADPGTVTRGTVAALAAAAAIALVALPATFVVVERLGIRQQARARYLELEQPEPRARSEVQRRLLSATVAMTVALVAFGLFSWPVGAADTKAASGGTGYQGNGIEFALPHRYVVDASGATNPDSGRVVAVSPHGGDMVEVVWLRHPAAASGMAGLFAVIDATAIGLPRPGDSVTYRGRPVELVVADTPALLENFSVGTDRDMTYYMVLATGCGSDRLVTVVITAESSRSVRSAVSGVLIPSLRC